jgi:uncharacterized membrane protein
MSITHMHLLLNHFPVIGTLLVTALFAVALMRKSSELSKVSLGMLAGLAVIAVIVYLTGESAEEAVEHLPGYSDAITETHEEVALAATIALGVVGTIAASVLLWMRRQTIPRWVTLASFAMSLAAGTMMGYTAMLGGQVRHTEVRPGAVVNVSPESGDR